MGNDRYGGSSQNKNQAYLENSADSPVVSEGVY